MHHYLQCGYNSKEILEIFKKYSKKIKYIDKKNIIKLIYGILIKRKIIINGLNSGEIIEKLINNVASIKNIEKIKDIKMPLLIPSVNVKNGEIYCFCSKDIRANISDKIIYNNCIDIGKAVRASCSYPVVFSPCEFGNIELVDGGIRENVPWKGLKTMGADKVISIIFQKEKLNKCCGNVIDVVSNSIDILSHELSNYETEGADYLLKIITKDIGLLDSKKTEELYNMGYETTKKNIKKIKKEINSY